MNVLIQRPATIRRSGSSAAKTRSSSRTATYQESLQTRLRLTEPREQVSAFKDIALNNGWQAKSRLHLCSDTSVRR